MKVVDQGGRGAVELIEEIAERAIQAVAEPDEAGQDQAHAAFAEPLGMLLAPCAGASVVDGRIAG